MKVFGRFVQWEIAEHMVYGTEFMLVNKLLLVGLVITTLQGCENSNRAAEDVYIERSAKRLPVGFDFKQFASFHVSSSQEDQIRMVGNLAALLADDNYKAVSIYCDSVSSCKVIIPKALSFVREKNAIYSKTLLMQASLCGEIEEEKFLGVNKICVSE